MFFVQHSSLALWIISPCPPVLLPLLVCLSAAGRYVAVDCFFLFFFPCCLFGVFFWVFFPTVGKLSAGSEVFQLLNMNDGAVAL